MNITDTVLVSYDNGCTDSEILYKDFVRSLIKKFEDERLEHCHAAMGITGEAGELSDAIKRHVIYGKEADRKNIVEELGDLEFFMENIRWMYGISRQETLQENANKLADRYKGLTYTDAAAIARTDKVGEAVMNDKDQYMQTR